MNNTKNMNTTGKPSAHNVGLYLKKKEAGIFTVLLNVGLHIGNQNTGGQKR